MSTANIFDLVDTWNDAATTFTAIKMNVTDTASAAASNLLDLQVGGVSIFRVGKNGRIDFSGTNAAINATGGRLDFRAASVTQAFVRANELGMVFNSALSWTSGSNPSLAADLSIFRDAADTLAQRRGANAQAFNLYNTFTNATNYERARMGWAGNAFQIRPEADGAGTTRVLHISGLPTSNPGPGILWNDGGTVVVGT
jgi:hypothetical protein